jgi:hypothetical protein
MKTTAIAELRELAIRITSMESRESILWHTHCDATDREVSMPDDKDRPNPTSNREKAEGDRWTSDPDTVEVADRYSEGVGKTNENSGGISNRELSEEIERQHNVPDGGTERGERNPEGDVER